MFEDKGTSCKTSYYWDSVLFCVAYQALHSKTLSQLKPVLNIVFVFVLTSNMPSHSDNVTVKLELCN